MPVNFYIAHEFRAGKDPIRILRSCATAGDSKILFKKTPSDYRFTGFRITQSIDEADYVLIPQSIKKRTAEWDRYFDSVYRKAQQYNKNVILFIGGDLAHETHLERPGLLVFKGSEYKHSKRSNEIIFPSYAEDLSEVFPFIPRHKQLVPTVGFCGYAGFPNLKTRLRYSIKNSLLDAISVMTLNRQWGVYKRGIYFRRKCIKILKRSERVETNFIIRDAFGGNTTTLHIDPEVARKEYIENILNADLVLCPKGDANYSVRFYETLSLGRIPLLIDTDIPLPLESVIDYSKFILRVHHTEISRLSDIVAEFYESLTDAEFIAMQEAAREAFKKYLRYDSFFNYALPVLKEEGIQRLW